MSELRDLLGVTAGLAADFYETLPDRAVYPRATLEELRAASTGRCRPAPPTRGRLSKSLPLRPMPDSSRSQAGATSAS